MRGVRLLACLALCALAACAIAVPKVVIVQQREALRGGVDPNVPLANYLAEQLDRDGRVAAIVWDMTDPIFREAVQSGRLVPPRGTPSLAQAQDGLRALGAEYVFLFSAARSGGQVNLKAALHRGRTVVWSDERGFGVQIDQQYDPDATAESIARTWTLQLATGPLRALPVRRTAETPIAAEGQEPIQVAVPERSVDNGALLDAVRRARPAEAILLLRDAVDAEPRDAERRRLLIDALLEQDQAELAAAEARRGAVLLPTEIELWLLAARAWGIAGRLEEAHADLNEAVVRAPKDPAVALLLGELGLRRLDPEGAIGHFDRAVGLKPTADAHHRRAVCRALLGAADGAKLDLAAARGSASTTDPLRQYRFAAEVFDATIVQMGGEIRNLIQRLAVAPQNPDLREEASQRARVVQSISGFLSGDNPPSHHSSSHGRRVLALALLSQSLSDLFAFVETRGEDAVTDARINLGEALKQAAAAREAFAAEGKEHAGGTVRIRS
jgi:tetratricopeptide (TPR) repeat protein